MPGYLDKVRKFEQTKQGFGIETRVSPFVDPQSGGQGNWEDAPKGFQQSIDCVISELSEKRSTLAGRLREGYSWLLDQHQRWQSGDTTAADDAEFSRVWNGWWELDHQLRADYAFQGCIYGPDGVCPEGFPCQWCADLPTPGVVARLELTGIIGT